MNFFDSSEIIYCDTEVDEKTKKINEIGLVYKDRNLQTTSVDKASSFLIRHSSGFIGGHNFIDFDMEIIKSTSFYLVAKKYHIIDTLPLSLLLLNEKTLHKLPKNYKDEDNFKNNPVKDSELTRDLFEK
ncbi:MAG: hypothetical protein Q9M39_07765 [Sulfurovum sp.]|nr:hypothetical protein [Sulfurovum sp.]